MHPGGLINQQPFHARCRRSSRRTGATCADASIALLTCPFVIPSYHRTSPLFSVWCAPDVRQEVTPLALPPRADGVTSDVGATVSPMSSWNIHVAFATGTSFSPDELEEAGRQLADYDAAVSHIAGALHFDLSLDADSPAAAADEALRLTGVALSHGEVLAHVKRWPAPAGSGRSTSN